LPIKALYVDDEPGLLDIVKLFLEQTGEIVVDCATCVGEAEKYLLVDGYDVVISDYQMPGMNGIEFLKRLRSRGCKIPFILFTGRGREEVAIDALNSGADFYMQKGGAPLVQFTELENFIKQGVHRYRSEKAERESDEHFRCLVENSFEGVGVHIDMVLIEANNAFCEITGYEKRDLIGKRMEDLFTKHSWEVMKEHLNEPNAEPYDVQIVRKDNAIISVKTRGKNISWNGQIARFSTILDLTERKNMEERLIESENVIQNLVETSPDIVWEIDAQGTFTYISPRVTEILGYDQGEFLGQPIICNIALDSLKRTEDGFLKMMRDRKEFTTKIGMTHMGGEVIEMEIRGAPFLGADGQFKGFRGIGRQLAPTLSDDGTIKDGLSMKISLATSPLGILIFDKDGCLADLNPAAMTMFGVKEESQIIGSMLFDHVREEKAAVLRQGKVVRCTTPYGSSHQEVSPGEIGRGEMLDISIIPHLDDSMSLIGYEMQVQKADEDIPSQINGRNALLNAILENSADAKVFALDRQYRYVAFNQGHADAIRQMWGNEIAIGTNLLDIIGKEVDRQKARRNFDEALAGRRFTVTEEYGDERLRRSVWRDHYSPMLSAESEVLGLTCYCLDVTELERSKRDLEDADHKLRIISDITRHDMLNKLTVLQGHLEAGKLLDPHGQMTGRFDKMIDITTTLVGQINQVKEYQDLRSVRPEWQSLGSVCRSSQEQLDHDQVQVHIETDGLEIYADPLLKRVFYNLMDNSLRHGHQVKNIWIGYERESPGLRIIYRDDGVGIDARTREHLFTEGVGRDHGLGLFLAKDILKITGIGICENGEAGKGARFEMMVPPGQFRFM
jgi:PAS domain S-box-containing protein